MPQYQAYEEDNVYQIELTRIFIILGLKNQSAFIQNRVQVLWLILSFLLMGCGAVKTCSTLSLIFITLAFLLVIIILTRELQNYQANQQRILELCRVSWLEEANTIIDDWNPLCCYHRQEDDILVSSRIRLLLIKEIIRKTNEIYLKIDKCIIIWYYSLQTRTRGFTRTLDGCISGKRKTDTDTYTDTDTGTDTFNPIQSGYEAFLNYGWKPCKIVKAKVAVIQSHKSGRINLMHSKNGSISNVNW